jgi:LPXTG-motif cell wall-anchored protein
MTKKVLIALALVLAASAATGTVASAQVSGESPTITTETGVLPNEQFRIFGSGCFDGTVDVTFNGQTFQDVPVDSQGNWFLDVTAPATPGSYTVESNCGGTVATTTVEVLSEAAAAAEALPRTGSSSTAPLVRIGLGAIVGGGLLLAFTRRRRTVDA